MTVPGPRSKVQGLRNQVQGPRSKKRRWPIRLVSRFRTLDLGPWTLDLRRTLDLGLWTLLCIGSVGCGRQKLNPGELERNHLFAEILEREDLRTIGEDEFFPKNLLSSPHPEVREWCAIALSRIGNPQALPWLYQAFHSPYAS